MRVVVKRTNGTFGRKPKSNHHKLFMIRQDLPRNVVACRNGWKI
jgi:hypothetical protein